MSADQLFMVRQGSKLVPLDGLAERAVEALPLKKVIRVRVTAARSVPQHRLYWSMLTLVTDNLDQPVTVETLHDWIKLKLGIVNQIRLRNGEIVETPGSIAFDKMTQAEFDKFFRAAVVLMVEHIIPGLRSADLEREARLMLGVAA